MVVASNYNEYKKKLSGEQSTLESYSPKPKWKVYFRNRFGDIDNITVEADIMPLAVKEARLKSPLFVKATKVTKLKDDKE